MTKPYEEVLASRGISYALVEDACSAMLRIASDSTINGRAFAILPRENCPEGYMDLAQDDTSLATMVPGIKEANIFDYRPRESPPFSRPRL
jgi:hypothetical protein